VLCRFIKSQLTGQALINALDKAKGVNKPPALSLSLADVRAAKMIKAISKGLSEGGDGSASTCTFGFVLQTVLREAAATEWELEALLDHFHALFASVPMNESEVIAGRAYTGPLYFKMNSSLRKASKKFGNQEHLKGNSYTNLIYACNSFLRKSSQISIIPRGRRVFRGMKGVKLPACFLVCMEGGGRGGVDFGFLSTSTNEEVAASYIGGGEMPVLFQFDVGDIDRGASLSHLSQYPNEDEVLIPPLSYLEVTGEPFFKQTDKGEVTVYPARINCNLKSQVRHLIALKRTHFKRTHSGARINCNLHVSSSSYDTHCIQENTFCRAHHLHPTSLRPSCSSQTYKSHMYPPPHMTHMQSEAFFVCCM
jgi:hypothetical protein